MCLQSQQNVGRRFLLLFIIGDYKRWFASLNWSQVSMKVMFNGVLSKKDIKILCI